METPTRAVRYFSAAGRMGRLRYLAAFLLLNVALGGITFLLGLVAAIAIPLADRVAGPVMLTLAGLTLAVALLLFLLWTIQRAHDFNASGWWSLLALVPLAGLVFLFVPGNEGDNRFGPPPPDNGTGVVLAATLPLAGAFLLAIPLLGILAAIAIPAYQGYVDASREADAARQAAPLQQVAPSDRFHQQDSGTAAR